MGLGYSSNGVLPVKLFSGAIYDSYQTKIYVQIYDNDEAFSIYEIPQAVIVLPDLTSIQSLMNKLIENDPNFNVNMILNEGSYLLSIQEIQSISSLLNEQSLSDKLGMVLNGAIFPQIFGPLSNYSGVKPVLFIFLHVFFFNSNILIVFI